MSNANKYIVKNKDAEKYTVESFCEKYNGTNVEQTKKTLIEKVMNPHYVSYEMKITICEKIIENSYYQNTENNGIEVKRLHINSPAKYMLYCLWLIKLYTNIEIDFSKSLKEFNLLNESGLLDVILNHIPEREFKEFRMILDMVENDVMQNEYETHAFISNQVERFGELTGRVLEPALNKLGEVLENMDEKTIDKMINKLNSLNGLAGLKEKFNIIK